MENMKEFLVREAVLINEAPRLQELALKKLHWSKSQWWDRMKGRVKLKESERIALLDLLKQVRQDLDNKIYNTRV